VRKGADADRLAALGVSNLHPVMLDVTDKGHIRDVVARVEGEGVVRDGGDDEDDDDGGDEDDDDDDDDDDVDDDGC
jgi:hypothetical protein